MNAPTPTSLAAMRQQQAVPREAQMPAVRVGFFDLQGFELLQRVAKAFASSTLVPVQYQGNVANCMIALNLSERLRADALMVMQNLYIVHGNPGWSSKFLIASVNTCGRYESLRYEWRGEVGKLNYGCRAWTIERSTGEKLHGIWVDWKMVKAEGWDTKKGSKWMTMPDQMFVYRSAAFWQRAYAPEISMGLQTAEELQDYFDAKRDVDGAYSVDMDALKEAGEAEAKPAGKVDTSTGEIIDAMQDDGGSRAGHDPDDDALRRVEQSGQQQGNGPGFEDAIAAVKSGEYDLARDIARSLGDGQKQAVEQAITNAQPPQPTRQRRERGQGGLGIE